MEVEAWQVRPLGSESTFGLRTTMTEQVAGGAGHPSSKADTRGRAAKVATRPYSQPDALIGWFCVAVGLAGGGMGVFLEGGPQGLKTALVALVLSGLAAFVAGVVTLVGRRWIQGPLLIVAGMGLVGIAMWVFIAAASVAVHA